MGLCWSCGFSLQVEDYGRSQECPRCRKDARVCKGCLFYDPSLHHACREPQADLVLDKEKANFCDYFKPQEKWQSQSSQGARAAAEALFKHSGVGDDKKKI